MATPDAAPLVGELVVNEGGKAVVIHTLNGDIVIKQEFIQAAQRKTWRPLAFFAYPTQNLQHDLRTNYPLHLILQLHKTFRDRGYIQFSGIITMEKQVAMSLELTVITLITNHHAYTGAIENTVKQLWDVNRDRVALQNALNTEARDLYANWSLDVTLLLDSPVAYQFTYDPDRRRISILPVEKLSASPSDYPDKASCTRELLILITAVLRSQFVMAGNLETILHSYPLSKLYLELLDTHSCDFNNVRINAHDVEEWDYVNPEADAVFKRYAAL